MASANATISRVQVVNSTTMTTNGSTLTFSPSALTAGNYIIITVTYGNGIDFRVNTSGTEKDLIGGKVGVGWSTGQSIYNTVYLYRVITGGQTSIVLTTLTGGTGQMSGILAEYSAKNLTPDVWRTGNTASSQTLTTNTTDTTNYANELVIATFGMKGTFASEQTGWANTPTNSFTIISQTSSSLNGVNDKATAMSEKIVTSTGTQSTGVSTSLTAAQWLGNIVTFREIPQMVTSMSGD